VDRHQVNAAEQVTQRGNRREPVFFGAEDYRLTAV
jgi:hypothetical protein